MPGWIDYLFTIIDIISYKNQEGFLVGGALRDIILERVSRDVDIVISERAAEIARYFADKIDASFVVLDKEREIYRVVKGNLVFDFAMMVGNDIHKDLSKRDFTINSMALPLDIPWKRISIDCNRDGFNDGFDEVINRYLIDPFKGIRDLRARKIRVNRNNVFIKDPLRLWRAVRFSGELNFSIENQTINIMKRDSLLADRPAPERIREELMKIFTLRKTVDILRNMEEEFRFLSCIIPEINEMKKAGQNKYHQENAWEHSLLVLDRVEELIHDKKYSKLVEEKEEVLLKLAALLHDIGKVKTKSIKNGEVHYYGHELKGAEMLGLILKNLKFKRSEISFIRGLVKYHMRPMNLYTAEKLTEKRKYRFFQQADVLVPLVLIHSLADKTAAMKVNERSAEITEYQDFVDKLLSLYKIYKKRTENLFISGKDIIDILKLEEGPYIGQLLDKISLAQGRGEIKSRDEAIAFLKKYIIK